MNKITNWFQKLLQKIGLLRPGTPTEVEAVAETTAVTPPPPPPTEKEPAARPLPGYSLRLITPGPDREAVVHFLQEYSGMSLAETRALVESAPAQVIKGLDPHTGRALLKKMEMLGATCELVGGMAASPDLVVRLPGPFDVILFDAGPNQALVVQIIRDLLNTPGISDAERLVKVTPKRIAARVSEETAVVIQQNLEKAGAAVRLIQAEEAEQATKHPDNSAFLFGDYDIILEQTGSAPEQVVQALRDLLNYRNLAEVEQLALYTPSQIIHSVPWETAVTIKNRLENAGATITIVAHS